MQGGKNEDGKWGGGHGVQEEYSLMKTEEIINLQTDYPIAEQAHLYLWVVNNLLQEGLDVMKAWGFKYITNLMWYKNSGTGMGNYFRGRHEILLFGRKGKPLPYRKQANGKKIFVHSAVSAPRRKHSQKPDEFYDMIEAVSYPPYLELFARNPEPRPNWSFWGNEV